MFLMSICLGGVNFSLSEVLQTLLGHGDANAVHRQIILDFRLPQVLTALLSGAALGTAGNPSKRGMHLQCPGPPPPPLRTDHLHSRTQ